METKAKSVTTVDFAGVWLIKSVLYFSLCDLLKILITAAWESKMKTAGVPMEKFTEIKSIYEKVPKHLRTIFKIPFHGNAS